MADMKKFYDDLMITNLYNYLRFWVITSIAETKTISSKLKFNVYSTIIQVLGMYFRIESDSWNHNILQIWQILPHCVEFWL